MKNFYSDEGTFWEDLDNSNYDFIDESTQAGMKTMIIEDVDGSYRSILIGN